MFLNAFDGFPLCLWNRYPQHHGFQALCVLMPCFPLTPSWGTWSFLPSFPDTLVFSVFFSGLLYQFLLHLSHPTGPCTDPISSAQMALQWAGLQSFVFHPKWDKECRLEHELIPSGACFLVQLTFTFLYHDLVSKETIHWVTCWLKHLFSSQASDEKCNHFE